jgi:hypothetical protein
VPEAPFIRHLAAMRLPASLAKPRGLSAEGVPGSSERLLPEFGWAARSVERPSRVSAGLKGAPQFLPRASSRKLFLHLRPPITSPIMTRSEGTDGSGCSGLYAQ